MSDQRSMTDDVSASIRGISHEEVADHAFEVLIDRLERPLLDLPLHTDADTSAAGRAPGDHLWLIPPPDND
jgi:hypothetical protein